MQSTGNYVGREAITKMLSIIGSRMADEGLMAEFAIFGGSALALTFDFRDATQDIDYMPISGDISRVFAIAQEVGQEYGLPDGWFNDAVEIFKSDIADYEFFGEFPSANPGIRVFTATPEYLLAMKTLSMRDSFTSHDVYDVWNLIDKLDISSPEQVIDIAAKFYPEKELPRRNELILKDLFDAKAQNKPYNQMMGW